MEPGVIIDGGDAFVRSTDGQQDLQDDDIKLEASTRPELGPISGESMAARTAQDLTCFAFDSDAHSLSALAAAGLLTP